ncbi:MAG: phosphoadenosine phosphosulfate reductase family protein [Ruminococcus sp.]|nr:phosphoadenosine phosphosulfate reductase family protein [Ruminococcus sp.]
MTPEKEQKAIERLKLFEPPDGYYLAYSGGKDSDCIKILAQLAGVKFEAHHNLTTVDAPETVYYVRSQPDVIIDKALDANGNQITMWNLILKNLMPPTRLARYCCSELKERSGRGRVVITGVRWAESSKRKENAGTVKIIGKPKTTQKIAEEIGADYDVTRQGGLIMNDDNDESRRMVEQCYRTTKTMVNPIIDWIDNDVWDFLNYYGCKSNPLYECGFKRIGCIGCPVAGKHRYVEFMRYPKFKNIYIAVFDKMLKRREELGKAANLSWKTGLDVFRWWMGEDFTQITFDDLEEL